MEPKNLQTYSLSPLFKNLGRRSQASNFGLCQTAFLSFANAKINSLGCRVGVLVLVQNDKKRIANSIQCSQAVTHPSTD